MDLTLSPTKWTPDELRRFFRAFQKYGCDFAKVSKMVGGGKAPELCATLYKCQQHYLDMDTSFQTESGFVSEVQGNAVRSDVSIVKNRNLDDNGAVEIEPPPPEDQANEGENGLLSSDEEDIGKTLGVMQKESGDHEENGSRKAGFVSKSSKKTEEENELDVAATVVAAMSSPQRLASGPSEKGSIGSTRSRRTPKRSTHHSPSLLTRSTRRTPASSSKKTRKDDIYEYYDDSTSLTESTRKRRSQKRLDFEMYNPAPTKRRQEADERKGLEALLALAGGEEEKNRILGSRKDPSMFTEEIPSWKSGKDASDHLILEAETQDELEAAFDGEKDEDLSLKSEGGNRARRSEKRTPTTTPSKTRIRSNRPSSIHTTPRRQSIRSPGAGSLGSPGLMGITDQDYLSDFYGDQPLFMLGSPGISSALPPGMPPSPQNPMPRLRKRKRPPETASSLLTPLRGLLGRHTGRLVPMPGSAALSVLTNMNIPGVASAVDPGPSQNAPELELKLRHCLGLRMRRWAVFEFFYSAIDRPWFMKGGMHEIATKLGIPANANLTRREWSILRSLLGRPRRFSLSFLREERAKLEAHRQASRASQNDGDRSMDNNSHMIPVGARVIARHPTTRALHDGCILTLGASNYRVQFDRQELGVELVRDTDVMPVEPWNCLPSSILRHRPELVLNGHLVLHGRVIPFSIPKDQELLLPTPVAEAGMPQQLKAALERKEALASQLRAMNIEAASGLHDLPDGPSGSFAPSFSQSYSEIVSRFREASKDANEKLHALETCPSAGVLLAPEFSEAKLDPPTVLPIELQGSPVTPYLLENWARKHASEVVDDCINKLVQQNDNVSNGNTIDLGPLRSKIEGAVQTMLVLKAGADKIVPASSVATALQGALLNAKPTSVPNAGVYTEIEYVVSQLKQTLISE